MGKTPENARIVRCHTFPHICALLGFEGGNPAPAMGRVQPSGETFSKASSLTDASPHSQDPSTSKTQPQRRIANTLNTCRKSVPDKFASEKSTPHRSTPIKLAPEKAHAEAEMPGHTVLLADSGYVPPPAHKNPCTKFPHLNKAYGDHVRKRESRLNKKATNTQYTWPKFVHCPVNSFRLPQELPCHHNSYTQSNISNVHWRTRECFSSYENVCCQPLEKKASFCRHNCASRSS